MQIDVLFLALVCGHMLGDFAFQSDWIAKKKNIHNLALLIHVLIVMLTSWFLLGAWAAWKIALALFLTHWVLDAVKRLITKRIVQSAASGKKYVLNLETQELILFGADQTAHMIGIIAIWWIWRNSVPANYWADLLGLRFNKGLILISGYVAAVWGSGILLKSQMADFVKGIKNRDPKDELPKAGEKIGLLERTLAFFFVLAGNPEGVGFIVAAKSVFRIGELTNKEDKKHAEYIMVGTMQSFTYALGAAFIAKWLITHIK